VRCSAFLNKIEEPLNTLIMKKKLLYLLLFTSFNLAAQTNNYSLEFDGVDDYVSVGNSTSLNPSNKLTLMCAFNVAQHPSANEFHALIGRNNTTTSEYGYNLGLRYLAGQVQLEFGVGMNTSGSQISIFNEEINYNFGEWAHVSGVFNQDTINLYYNGTLVLDSIISGFGNLHANSYETFIGKYRPPGTAGGWFYEGLIDNVHIWNNALTQQEIQDYMNCPPTGNEAGLVGFWDLEEGSGTSTTDQTSNGNDGTLNSGVTWSTDVPTYNCCTVNPITSQPTDQTVNIGNNATFLFTDNLTGATYQWQMDSETGYSDLSNAGQFSGTDTQTLTISSTTMSNNNTLYRCIVAESANCMDTTDVSTLAVIDNPSPDCIGDLNGDGFVTLSDLTILLTVYGSVCD
jgi:hypothetical protein